MRKYFFQLCVSLLLLGFFATKVDWIEMRQAFSGLSARFYILSVSAAIIGPVVMAGKYHLLISHTSLGLPFSRMVAINYMARLYALFLPTALGPEAVRWYKITKNKPGKSLFLASTMVERIFFIMVLLICGSMPLFLSDEPAIRDLTAAIKPILFGTSLCFFLALIYFLKHDVNIWIFRYIVEKFNLSPRSRIYRFLDNFKLQNVSLTILVQLFLLTILWQCFFLFRMYFLFVAVGLPFSFLEVTWMGSLVLLLQIVPVSFAGLGVREGAFAFLFSLYHVPSEAGVVVGLLFFSQMLILCVIGWGCLFLEKETQ
jgi:hypothetical protein